MNGAAHFGQAEALLNKADEYRSLDEPADAAACVAEAQVHATLALAAITALPHIGEVGTIHDDCHLWAEATAPVRTVPAGPVAAMPYAAVPR